VGLDGQRFALAALPPGMTRAPGPVLTVADNLAPTGIRSTMRPARRDSLYRLRHPDPQDRQCIITQY